MGSTNKLYLRRTAQNLSDNNSFCMAKKSTLLIALEPASSHVAALASDGDDARLHRVLLAHMTTYYRQVEQLSLMVRICLPHTPNVEIVDLYIIICIIIK